MRLGVNIDHVATLRNARGTTYPDPVKAATLVAKHGADSITAHLREDRRHIKDDDMKRLRALPIPLNMEMAPVEEMVSLACKIKPAAVCLVPEKRQELTTEGGLDVVGHKTLLKPYIARLKECGIRTSLFIDPDEQQIRATHEVGADAVELHTGEYAEKPNDKDILVKMQKAAKLASSLGMQVHAGHGLTYENVKPIAAIPEIEELNIGHFLVAEAVFVGLDKAVTKMKELMLSSKTET